MNKYNCLEGYFRIQTKVCFLFRTCVKKAVAVVFDPSSRSKKKINLVALWLLFIGVCRIQFVIQYENLNVSSIYYGAVPFQYLKTVVAMQHSTLSEIGSQIFFRRSNVPMQEQWGRSKHRHLLIYFVLTGACVLYIFIDQRQPINATIIKMKLN